MNTNRLIHKIEPYRFARAGIEMEGDLPVSSLKRLVKMLSDASGSVHLRLSFFMEKGTALVKVNGEVNVMLECQRCLTSYSTPISLDYTLAVVEHDAAVAELSEGYEPFVLSAAFMSPVDIIEDELLLNVPVVPKHAHGDPACMILPVVEDAPNQNKTESPFASLKNITRLGT